MYLRFGNHHANRFAKNANETPSKVHRLQAKNTFEGFEQTHCEPPAIWHTVKLDELEKKIRLQ